MERPISTYSKGRSANVAAIGTTREWRKEHVFDKRDITWEQALGRVPGAWNPDERVKMMTAEGIDMSILYPTLGLAFARMEGRQALRRLLQRLQRLDRRLLLRPPRPPDARSHPPLARRQPQRPGDAALSPASKRRPFRPPLAPPRTFPSVRNPLGRPVGRAPGTGHSRIPPRRLRRHFRIQAAAPGD